MNLYDMPHANALRLVTESAAPTRDVTVNNTAFIGLQETVRVAF